MVMDRLDFKSKCKVRRMVMTNPAHDVKRPKNSLLQTFHWYFCAIFHWGEEEYSFRVKLLFPPVLQL